MLISLAWGCAVAPKTLSVKDRSQSFEAKSFESGTIISTKTGQPISFEALVSELAASRVIYVGERHTDRSHHEIQLKIIKGIFEKHPSMAVGMEMFDHSYQSVLDQWADGQLDQKSFVEKTHWSYNWKFDFDLYSDILNFVKENQIRLVGLNIPLHIQRKIARGGIESIFGDDKKHLPEKIDLSNTAHRAYVEKVYKSHHHMRALDNFEYFYMAQCVWEDAMAEAIAENLNADIMVVIAGHGHLQYKYGIPDRAFHRTKADFRTVYPAGVGGEVDLGIADFIWVTP
jgi:uncharacterized iron-regulated protein